MCIAVQPQLNYHSKKLQDLLRISFPAIPIKIREYSKFTVVHVTVIPGEMPRREWRKIFWFVGPGNALVIAALVLVRRI